MLSPCPFELISHVGSSLEKLQIEIAFLLTHYVRQRFREALLYSFAVARPINGTESVWGKREKDELRALEIESWKGQAGTFMSRAGWNDKGYKHVLRKAGEDELMATTFDFGTSELSCSEGWSFDSKT